MTSITIVWDSEDVSEESLSNWCDALYDKGLLTDGFVSKVLINNKVYRER